MRNTFSRMGIAILLITTVFLLRLPSAIAKVESESESALTYPSFLQRPLIMDQKTEWNQKVQTHLAKIHERYYRKSRIAGTSGFTHGHKTKIAILLIHGLFMNEKFFSESVPALFDQGYNVFNLTLPGHEMGQTGAAESDANKWSAYLDEMLALARSQAEKVVVIGHSIGGGLALLAAQKKVIDGLVLFQPALKITQFVKGLALFGNEWKRFRSVDSRLEFMLGTAETAFQFLRSIPDLTHLPLFIPTLLFSSNIDLVVSSAAQLKFAELNPSKIQLVRHFQVHMYNPLSDAQDRQTVSQFLQTHF